MTQDLDPFDVRLGSAIRARREALKITQSVLAANIGVTFQQVQKYERGTNRVAAARLMQISALLDIPASELLGEHEAGDKPGARTLLQWFNQIENAEQRDALLAMAKALRTEKLDAAAS